MSSVGVCTYVRRFAFWKNFGEPREFREPNHLSDVYLPVHATQCFCTEREMES